ncbi:MAG: PAS domain S-box protein [Rhizobiaceae bacterium]|nr:PAS domain S-box protein [Rhizobiaceae bacterium]
MEELVRVGSGADPFSAAVRSTRMAMVITDPRQHDNPIVFANDAFSKLTGFAREEILGRNCRFLQGEETDPDDVARIRRGIEERATIELDLRNHRKDGSTFWNRLLVSPVFDGDELIFFFASQYDVTLEREGLVDLQRGNEALEAKVRRRTRDLSESEERLRFVLHAGRIGTWTLDLGSNAFAASDVLKESVGRGPGEALTFADLQGAIFPEDMDRMRVALAASQSTGSDYEIEYRVVARNGDIRWLHMRGQPSFESDGGVVGMSGICLDITERKRAELALAESEARFRTMSDHAPVMIWTTDASGYCTYLNRQWHEFTGQSEGESQGYGWLEATHPDDKAMAEEVFVTANASAAAFRIEYRLRTADGSYRWAIDAAAPRFAEDGRFLGYVGSVIDIDDRKRMEAEINASNVALKASNDRFRGAVEANSGVIWTNDADGQMRGEQPGWAELTGQTFDEYQGYGWSTAVHPEDVDPSIEAWNMAVRERTPFVFEHRIRRYDGVYRQFSVRAIPVFEPTGDIREWVGVHTDVTDHNEAEEHRRLLTRELTHRVKNTMATVQAIVGQTLRSTKSVENATRFINARIQALSDAHNVLTRENWAGASLAEVVDQALSPFQANGGGRLHTKGPPVRLRPRVALAISMALHELATNAVKYGALSNDDGIVRLSWDIEDDDPSADGHLWLSWEELGGPPVAEPTRRGFGSRMIERALSAELGGVAAIEYRPSGIVFKATAPLSRIAEVDDEDEAPSLDH